MPNNGNKNKFDIHDRIFKFVVAVLKLMRKVPRRPENLVILGQLGRSITSTGANDQEADAVSTKADFIHKYTIVRKEAKESLYWLRVLAELNPKLKDEAMELISEGDEIVKIVSTIIRNAQQKK